MIQTRPYEFMVSYTPQRQWIEKGGIKLWLAFFFIELGAGMFFIASLFDNLRAMSAGWVLCAVLGGGLHLLYLGKPLRFWRMVLSSGWKTSWISRGLVFVTLFLALGLVHIVLTRLAARSEGLLIAADVFAFLTIIYGGFAMNYVNGIPLWNTALLPILYVISGLWGGAEATLGIALASGEVGIGAAVEEWVRILLLGFMFLIPVYLMSVRYTSAAGQVSVRYMISSRWSPLFWVAVIILGMAIPLASVVKSILTGLDAGSMVFFYVAIFSGLIGDLAMRYLILRGGVYAPLIPSSLDAA
jgi:formate-dependent nitrite reductase membrane component NrfD